MANISQYLAAILAATLGRDVRGSIHDAIYEINKAQEQAINAGTDIEDGDPGTDIYGGSLYFNTDTNDLLEFDDTTNTWNAVDNLMGEGIASITGPVTSGLVDTYTINFEKELPSQTFTVTNGRSITSITKTGTSGLVDEYTIAYNDSTTSKYYITNGKDGNTVLRGNEVTGTTANPTQFTLSVKCQTGDTYLNTSGNIYLCTQGAEANQPSLWSYSFSMAGGGGAQYLDDLQDVNVSTAVTGQILSFDGSAWVPVSGGSGHTMKPDPATHPTEAQVVSAINTASLTDTNNEVGSLYGISKWTNVKTCRVCLTGANDRIGHYGVGQWQDSIVGTPSATDEANWGWWHHEAFKMLDPSWGDKHGYDVDFKFGYDPRGDEPITLGGYIIDTTNGYICIKFANYVMNPAAAKIFVDITVTRNDINDMPNS